MKKIITLFIFGLIISLSAFSQEKNPNDKQKVDKRIDNMGYWKKLAREGLVPVQPKIAPPAAIVKGSTLNHRGTNDEDSPDVSVNAATNNTQSETSIAVDPTDNSKVLNSNNSTDWNGGSASDVYGASYFASQDWGQIWDGNVHGPGGDNSGDPAAAINLNGRRYIGYIHNNYGQGVSYSDDGVNWTPVLAGVNNGSILDKNHLWVDISPLSPYKGYVYNAWTDFGGSMDKEIAFVRSTNHGVSYSTPINLSAAVNAGSHNQGVNINSGPNGELYVIWSVYDASDLTEDAIGFAKSLNGGATFSTGSRIITNLKGIRTTGVLKNHRVNSFPSMAVDISGGDNDGAIYVVFSNIGTPGVNSGTNKSVYVVKSTDQGATWGSAVKVNQGPFVNGKEAYFPWITCDPETGVLSVIFYDDRNTASNQVETWVANSYDGGLTWEDFRVSDVAFTPQPISGLASGYMGDYLGITARGGVVYPVWPDNRNGLVKTYVSPYSTNTRVKPTNLVAALNETDGSTHLTWEFAGAATFDHFIVYRNNVEIGTTTELFYDDVLPTYGKYTYKVSAYHTDGESSPTSTNVQWGHPEIQVVPDTLEEQLLTNQTSTKTLTVTNIGELPLTYNVSSTIINTGKNNRDYCAASGGGGDEHISNVQFGSINNSTSQTNYGDYTALSTQVDAGNTYPITVTNGEVWSSDDLGVWIDFNIDGDFDDANENVVCEVSNGGQGTYNITIPSEASAGNTRMRIRIKYSGEDCGSPCGTTSWGEVEDYTIIVNSWLQVEGSESVLAPGTSETINVNFDSTDLALGEYNATINFNSDAQMNPELIVPVTLFVVEDLSLNATPYADANPVCVGESTILHANANGGSGTYTYSWTSDPVGFTSSEADPAITPTENTIYFVEINDGVDTVNKSVAITLNTIPEQPSTPVGATSVCQDDDNTEYSVENQSNTTHFVWTINPVESGELLIVDNSVFVNWNETYTGTVTLSVNAANDCGESAMNSSISIEVSPLPTVTVSPDFIETCIQAEPFELSGGTPAGGYFSGAGVENGLFDPSVAGLGNHAVYYNYSDGNGCENQALLNVIVFDVPTVTLAPFAEVEVDDEPFLLTGGSPEGGEYSGPGVTDNIFDPSAAGIGLHDIVYTYTDAYGCSDSATEKIQVSPSMGYKDVANGISVNVYPNPAKDLLKVDLTSVIKRNFEISVYNQLGLTVFKTNLDNSQYNYSLDVSKYANGLYYLKVQDNDIQYVVRFVVE